MLMKLTPGVNFTNMFMSNFYARRSQKQKMTVDLAVIFAPLVSTCVKAAHKMLVKSICQFHQKILSAFFVQKCFYKAFL